MSSETVTVKRDAMALELSRKDMTLADMLESNWQLGRNRSLDPFQLHLPCWMVSRATIREYIIQSTDPRNSPLLADYLPKKVK